MKHIDPKRLSVSAIPGVRAPDFITFTGVDAKTSVEGMTDLARRYPVEWGVLLSPRRQGREVRYPDGETLSRLWWSGLNFSAHLCGDHSRDVMAGRDAGLPVDLGFCRRFQVNSAEPDADRIVHFADGWGVRPIAQARGDAFPADDRIDWLYDPSGGRGARPDRWPPHPGGDRLVGYAGGIAPDNVAGVLAEIGSTGPYWIDMESGVRSGGWRDRFDLRKAEAVCRAVYGGRGQL